MGRTGAHAPLAVAITVLYRALTVDGGRIVIMIGIMIRILSQNGSLDWNGNGSGAKSASESACDLARLGGSQCKLAMLWSAQLLTQSRVVEPERWRLSSYWYRHTYNAGSPVSLLPSCAHLHL